MAERKTIKMLPQIIVLVLIVLSLGINMAQHGTPKTGKNSFWVSLVSAAITLGLLWWGGFFNGLVCN